MQRQQLVDEIKVLMGLVADKTTTLADSVMEIDVNEYTDQGSSQHAGNSLLLQFTDHIQDS